MSGGAARGCARLGPLGWAAALALATVALRAYLEWAGPFPGDRWLLGHFGGRALTGAEGDLVLLFAVLGSPAVAAGTVLAAVWFVWRSSGRIAAAFVVLASVGLLANGFLKVLAGTTPLMAAAGDAEKLNFPSGHAFYAAVLCGSIGWVAWRAGRRDITFLAVLLAAAMGPSRILLNIHHFSDVLAGYLAGGAWLLVAAVVTGWSGRG